MKTKRLMLSIPVAGMALTTVGCGDPIVSDAEALTALDFALPYSGSYDYQGYTVTFTDLDIANFTINKDLTTTLKLTGNVTVTDAGGVEVQNADIDQTYDGVVTVVDKGAKYNIALSGVAANGDPINTALTCDLNNDVNLACTDDNDLAWAFKLVE